jgi:uncharacterized repeat protein (TIGR01451 family)
VLDPAMPAGVTQIANTATIADGGSASSSANDTTPVTLTPGLSLAKSDNNATAIPGGLVVYTLNYQNSGNVDLTGVLLSETVPANTAFDAANSSAGWSCLSGAPAAPVARLPSQSPSIPWSRPAQPRSPTRPA